LTVPGRKQNNAEDPRRHVTNLNKRLAVRDTMKNKEHCSSTASHPQIMKVSNLAFLLLTGSVSI